jgi:hypothetical protein
VEGAGEDPVIDDHQLFTLSPIPLIYYNVAFVFGCHAKQE